MSKYVMIFLSTVMAFFLFNIILFFIAAHSTHKDMTEIESIEKGKKIKKADTEEILTKIKEKEWICTDQFKNSLFYDTDGRYQIHASIYTINYDLYQLSPLGFLKAEVLVRKIYKEREKYSFDDHMELRFKNDVPGKWMDILTNTNTIKK